MSHTTRTMFFFPLCLSLLISFAASQDWKYKYYKLLDREHQFVLGWKFNDTHIEFQISAATTGYLGFGFSKAGRMYDADIAMGWILNDQLYVGDYYTNSTSRTPFMDRSQDWTDVKGSERNGTTVLEFVRKLDTCDPHDIPITKDRLILIWSLAYQDPDVNTGMVPYHGLEMRGAMEIFLLESDAVPPNYPPPDTLMVKLNNTDYSIPATGSTLLCIVFDLTSTVERSNLIKFAPEITPGNEPYVYRMVLYRCNFNNDSYDRQRYDCEKDAPLPVKSCKSIVATWSMGAETFHFPQGVGISMGGPMDPSKYVLEIHYSKFAPTPEEVLDNSGLVLTYTKSPVLHNAGMLELGKVVSKGWKQFIPDGEANFTTTSYCSPRCMDWGLGSDQQITVLGVMFKGNDVSTSVRLRHFRGQEELPTISEDNKFSNFFQGSRLLDEPVTVRSTDTLSVECTFNTLDRQAVTRGGWSRIEEVCRATIVYYPAKPFDLCLSWSSLNHLMTRNGTKVAEANVMSHLTKITDWDAIDKELFKDALDKSDERSICSSVQRSPAYAIDKYKQTVTKKYQKPSICKHHKP